MLLRFGLPCGERTIADGDSIRVAIALASVVPLAPVGNPMYPWDEDGDRYTWLVAHYAMSSQLVAKGWSVTRRVPDSLPSQSQYYYRMMADPLPQHKM